MLRKFAVLFAALTLASPAAAQSMLPDIYAKVFGGVTLADNLAYESPATYYDTDAGTAFGGAIGFDTPIDGLSVEADILHSSAEYTGAGGNYLAGTSVMGNLVYTALLNETFALYGGVGAGAIFVHYDTPINSFYDADGIAPGFQFIAGASAALTEQLDLFAEYRYQGTFGDVTMTRTSDSYTYPLEFKRSAVLAGLKIDFN